MKVAKLILLSGVLIFASSSFAKEVIFGRDVNDYVCVFKLQDLSAADVITLPALSEDDAVKSVLSKFAGDKTGYYREGYGYYNIYRSVECVQKY